MYMKVGETWYLVTVGDLEEARIDQVDPEKLRKALDNPKRFDPVGKAVGARSIGSRRSTSSDKDLVATYLQALKPGSDKRAYSKAKNAWLRHKTVMRTDLQGLVTDLSTGKLTKTQFLHNARKVFKTGYEKAYRLGTDASGLAHLKLPAEDLRWLKRVRSREYQYLDKFADDIVAKKGSMSYDNRASMYVDGVDSTFDAARVDAYPNEGTKVYWELSPAENCGDCLDLALNSPYTPDTLPTTPRAGGTMCLSGCKCHLRIRYQRPEALPISTKPVPASVAKVLGLTLGAKAIRNLTKNGDKAGIKPADLDFDGDETDWEDWADLVDHYNDPLVLDWNKLDDMLSALTTLRLLENKTTAPVHRLVETQRELDSYQEACKGLPDWLDPYSRDVYVWHGIGTVVLDNIKAERERGDVTE